MTIGPLLSLITRKRSSLFSWRPFDAGDIAELTRLIEAGQVPPVIDRTFALGEVPDALRFLDEKRSRGKIVIAI
jgi:NADPH:quinone reductase-like Zn-dependent oxidoreductase